MPRAPRVAIVTPSLNLARFIGQTVDSVLAQDYPHIDYLVMDAGSRDGTVELLEERGVRYVSEPDGGQGDAVNRGFERTSGDLFTFLNADDTLLPGAITKLVEAFERNPAAGVVYGDADFVDERGEPVFAYPTRPFYRERLARECFICQPAALMRREVFERAGRMDPSVECALDYDLWLRASRFAGFVYLPHRLATSRMYEGNKSLGRRDTLYRESFALAKREFGYVPMSWIGPYSEFRVTGADQFGRPSKVSARSKALALALGARHNPRRLRRFLADWRIDGRDEPFSDGWMSKAAMWPVRVPGNATRLIVAGRHHADVRWPLVLTVSLDARRLGVRVVRRRGPFELSFELPAGCAGDRVAGVRSLWTWRPNLDGDVRKLSCLIDSVAAS